MDNPTRKDAPSRDAGNAFADFPLADADACVKCGLCLPHCPTYALSRHEGDSPRGRIALLQGLAHQAIKPRGSALSHLDGCLTCRACERVCPAEVQYGRLIDAGRTGLWRAGHRPGAFWRMLAFFRRTPFRLRLLSAGIRVLRYSKIDRVLARLPLGKLTRTSAVMRDTHLPVRAGVYPPASASRGRIGLFLGCVARPLDARVARASVKVLNALGYSVVVPEEQVCCGAMDSHAGDVATAKRLAEANSGAFDSELDAIISTASGCAAELQNYSRYSNAGNQFSARVVDIMSFVVERIDHLPSLSKQNASVLVHAPCTLRNAMRARKDATMTVLERIPGLMMTSLDHRHCCGAAGSYLFEQPVTADQLGTRLLDALPFVPQYFATANIGCSLHLQRLADARGLKMQLCHPVELLAASLPSDCV